MIAETEQLFAENPQIEAKLNQVKVIVVTISDLIKAPSDAINVSFGVFEGFNSLATANVRQYRGLESLKIVKSSFQPTFEDK